MALRLNTSEECFTKVGKDTCRFATDIVTGKPFVKVAEVIPSEDETDPGLKAKREKILAQNPQHFASHVPGFTGYWVEQVADPTAPAEKEN